MPLLPNSAIYGRAVYGQAIYGRANARIIDKVFLEFKVGDVWKPIPPALVAMALRLYGAAPPAWLQDFLLAHFEERVEKPRKGRRRIPRKAERDDLARRFYARMLEAFQAEEGAKTPKEKNAIPKSERSEQTPHYRAAQATAALLHRLGYGMLGIKQIQNIVTSSKKAELKGRNSPKE